MELVFDNIHIPHRHSFIARRQVPSKKRARIHSHNNYELNFVREGRGKRIVGSNISTFTDNDLVLLGPELPHCWENDAIDPTNDDSSIVIHFYEKIIGSNFFNIPELEPVENLLMKANKGIWFKGPKVENVKTLLQEIVEMKGLESYIQLLKVFNELLQIDDVEYLSDTSYIRTIVKEKDNIHQIYEYVFNNIQKGIHQDKAADIVHMTPGAFCRYFKKKTNQTFMEYVKQVRIQIAVKMLAETDKQISQICYESGYNNIANFNYQFKSLMRKTPSEYRKVFR